MKVVRDVLDKKLIDRENCEMGRVSGLLMQAGKDSQPRLTHLLIGGPALWMRVHPRLANMATSVSRMLGPKRTTPVRIPWSRVATVGRDIRLDVKARDTGALDWEIWVAQHIIERIPGSGSEEEE